MATATERIIVLMTRAEKRTLERKAKRIGASAAELVRRSVQSFDPDLDETEMGLLLETLVQSHKNTLAALDLAEREIKETRAYFTAKSKAEKRGHR